MKLLGRILVAALFLALPASASVADSSNGVTAVTLPNGMRVVVREGHSINLAAVDIWVRAGSINETEENNGISHFVEHMIFKATRKYGPGLIDREIEGLGAELNGGTSRDWVHFYTTVRSEYLPAALDILADAIMNARFRPEDVEKERLVLLDEIARAESDPSNRARNAFARVAFTHHPYRLPPMGARDSINKLTRDDLAAYYNRYYNPANTCVAIAGDISPKDAVDLVQRAFAGFDRPATPAPDPAPEPSQASARVKRFRWSDGRAYVVLGYRSPPATALREMCALDLILAVLGDTHRGRISAALSSQGIRSDRIITDFVAQRYPGNLAILVSVDPEDAEKVAPLLLSELRRLADEPLADGELSQAKRLVEGSDLFEQETFSGQARLLGLYDSIATYDLALRYSPVVRSLSASEVQAAASRYFAGNSYSLAVIKPEDTAEGRP